MKNKLKFRLMMLRAKLTGKFKINSIHYINSPQILPPPLSKDEEESMTLDLQSGSKKARDKLIEHNLRLVVYIAKKFESSGVNIEDLVSIGTIGLIKAIDSFDADKGVRLATYAARCVENEILMYFRSKKKDSGNISVNEPIDVDSEGNPLTIIDTIYCDDTISDDIDLKNKTIALYKYIEEMSDDREREIIIRRYGLYNQKELTQREIAAEMGISRSYVSRIEKRVLQELRDKFDGI